MQMEPASIVSELLSKGIPPDVSTRVAAWLDNPRARNEPWEAWTRIYREVLTPAHDFSVHLALYEQCYATAASTRLDGPAWLPAPDVIARAHVTDFARQLGVGSFRCLHRWSVENREEYWRHVIERLGI